MEGVVDFRRGELLGVKRKHLRRRQIFGIKVPFPLGVLKSRGADPEVHQGSGQDRPLCESTLQEKTALHKRPQHRANPNRV